MEKGKVWNHIRKFRFNHGEMTQQNLADRLGVSRQTVIAIESGKYSPSLELAFRIAAIFQSELSDVFYYDPPDDL
ncbi:MAG: helix-turn-helix transcriptional regulator [Calditrichaeota bacterium]|nr:helix-turn-helix transcriptional regulator [Calditrichota bacterium]